MSDHVHSWDPIPLAAGRYECSCGATAWRRNDGAIVAHRAKFERPRAATTKLRAGANGRVAPKPGAG